MSKNMSEKYKEVVQSKYRELIYEELRSTDLDADFKKKLNDPS